MKLELKHIAPYLPYGLKFELLDYKCDYVGEKYGICNGYYLIGDGVYYTFKSRDTAGKNRNNCKPILRPLSDLIKEIDIEGLFVPISFILHDYRPSLELKMNLLDGVLVEFWLDYPDSDGDYVQESSVTLIDWLKLLEWHFDVFGLIDQGLAININDL